MHKAWSRQINRIKNMRWRKARIQWAVTAYLPEGDLTPFGQIWRKEERSKPVAFGTNRKGKEELSQAAEIRTILPERKIPTTQTQGRKYSFAIKAVGKSGAEISTLFLVSHVPSNLWGFWLVHWKPTRKGCRSQDKNSLCKPEFRMSWGDKVLTGEREGENKTQKTKTNQKKPCRVWTWTQTRTVKKGGETRTSMRRIFSVPSLSSRRDRITAVKQCFRRSCREYLIFKIFFFYPWWNYFASTVLFILSQAELGSELSPMSCEMLT